MPLAERCILGFNSGPPMVPGPYNNLVQVFQGPGYVVIVNEMVHDARIVSLDGRPHLRSALRSWTGDSRGRWEGDTLVVETKNLTDNGTGYVRISRIDRQERAAGRTLHTRWTIGRPCTDLP